MVGERRERQAIIEIATMLRAFLPRMSRETSEAWALMIAVERLAPIAIHREGTREVLDAEHRTVLIGELRAALIAIAREMGSQDWPAPKVLLEAIRRERERNRQAQLGERMKTQRSPVRGLLAAQGSVTNETLERNAQRAREMVSLLRERMSLAGLEDDTQESPRKRTIGVVLSDDLDAADRRRAELRAQAARLQEG